MTYTAPVMTPHLSRCRSWGAVIALLLATSAAGAAGKSQADTARELDALQKRITRLEQDITRDAKARPTANKALKEAEQAEAGARRALGELRERLAAGQARVKQLRADMSRAEAAMADHREALGRQLRLAYATGREEWLRVALSGKDPVALSRRIVYYRYITRERGSLLADLQAEVVALETAAQALQEELATLAELGTRQEARVRELTAARQVRANALRTLERDLGTRRGKLDGLRRNARSLEQLMQRLAKESRARKPAPARETPPAPPPGGQRVTGLPLEGRVVARFGQPRADGLLRWDGLVLAAPAGTEVRAVRAGRVVYADWLPGMGQLVVVDHGKGYMSLYGHNQELLRKTGQQVQQGELLARVGDSGGQSSPGLYFELRRNGKPIDPRGWIK